MDCEEPPSSLQLAVGAWLESLNPQLQEGCLRLDIDVLDLAISSQHGEVVAALLEDPEKVRQAVIGVLSEAGLLDECQRVWLRPRQLMAAAELSVPQGLECMRAAPGALFSCHGVCVAATAVFQQPASRALQCASCSKVWTVFAGQEAQPCCGGLLQEVAQARDMVQGQVLWLCSDTPMHTSPATQLGNSILVVRLTDDLCSRVRVGDRVLATGCGRFFGGGSGSGAGASRMPYTLGVQMEAWNLQVLQPTVLTLPSCLGAGTRHQLDSMSQGGLESILDVLDAAVPTPASPLLKLALLVSAVGTGTGSAQLQQEVGDDDPDPQAHLHQRAATSRNQVNVMLTSAGPEPHIQRLLCTLAATLCDHSVHASAADPRTVLPALETRHVDSVLRLQVPLAAGGQLAEASCGALLLSSSTLTTKIAIGLGQFMAAGEAALHPGCPELCVPVGATLWTMMHEQDLSHAGQYSSTSALSLTERIINRFSQPFFAQHDILLPAGPEGEDEAELLADSILLGLAAAVPVGAAALNRQQQADALRALQYQIEVGRAQPQPQVSEEAAALLTAYFLHLRDCQEAQQGVLASLVRVASACARLRHSPTVESLPDAALAVAFLEEKLLAAGAMPLFWPRWRDELQRCTELGECLRGLVEECGKGLGVGPAAEGAWAEEPEE